MIYLALGSNLAGDYADSYNLLLAVPNMLAMHGVHVVATSRFYQSTAIGGPRYQPDYINAVVAVRSVLSPRGLLSRIHDVEVAFGRTRRVRWAARTLDIDILDMNGRCHADYVDLPHPRLASRAFVLLPLRDVMPGWRHPQSGESVAQLIADLSVAARRGVFACTRC